MEDRKILTIIGMHRSGTSLLAQWLYRSGLNLGDKFLPANASNKDGYFEDIDFIEIHERILKKYKIPYGGLTNIERLKVTENEVYIIQKLLEVKLRNKEWGWKDPRTCLFLKEYIKLLPDLKVIIILRNYRNIINSLINRDIKSEYIRLQKTKSYIK